MNKYYLDRVSEGLDISITALQEVKNRLGIKGQINEEEFILIQKVVGDVKERYGKVTNSIVNVYWFYYGDKWKNARRIGNE